MTQRLSIGLFVAGLMYCLVAIGHDLQEHSTWREVAQPKSIGEMVAEVGAAGVMVAGALGIRLTKGNGNG